MTATMKVQNRNNNSQVTYICITSPFYEEGKKDIDFLGNEEATATVYGNSYGSREAPWESISHL